MASSKLTLLIPKRQKRVKNMSHFHVIFRGVKEYLEHDMGSRWQCVRILLFTFVCTLLLVLYVQRDTRLALNRNKPFDPGLKYQQDTQIQLNIQEFSMGEHRRTKTKSLNVPVAAHKQGVKDTQSKSQFVLAKSPLDRKVLSYDSILSAELVKARSTTTPYPNKSLDDPIECKALFQHEQKELERVDKIMARSPYRPLTPAHYLQLTSTCRYFLRERGYFMEQASQEERDFPLAFGIRMHKAIEQAERLLRAIYRPHNVYCIHVDNKSEPLLHQAMSSIANCLPNVFMSSRAVNYVYGSFSPVEADLICMQDLMATNVKWKYFLNLAGTEFPLKSNLEIVKILQYLNGTNDVEQFEFPDHFKERYEFKWKTMDDLSFVDNNYEPKAPFPDKDLVMMKGCSYNSFSRPFVHWILTDPLPQRFLDWAKDTNSPDETVWATLNRYPRAPGGYPVIVTQVAKTLLSREVLWERSAAYCHGKRVHQICILSIWELKWLSYRWELFANKFDLEVDPMVYICLEEWLSEKRTAPDIQWHGIDRAPHVIYVKHLHRNDTKAKELKLY